MKDAPSEPNPLMGGGSQELFPQACTIVIFGAPVICHGVNVVGAQYASGFYQGKDAPGYRREKGVAAQLAHRAGDALFNTALGISEAMARVVKSDQNP